MDLHIVSIRENLEYKEQAIAYFQKRWASDDSMMVYEDCISHCIGTTSSLPQWYLLLDGERIVGCAGLITNDFISRMDLYPWLCALYIEEDCRGNALGCLLIEKCKADTKAAGFDNLKGHKSVGGLRASIYNAMPIEGVAALVECLKQFEQTHK